MKKLLILAIASIMSLGASAQLITSNTVTYKKVVATTASVLRITLLVQVLKVLNLLVEFLCHGLRVYPLQKTCLCSLKLVLVQPMLLTI